MPHSETPAMEPVDGPVSESAATGRPSGPALARIILLGVIVAGLAAIAIATALRNSDTTTASADSRDTLAMTAVAGEVHTAGRFEVTAKLVELPGKFLANDGLYNYAFVLKYEVLEVHRSEGEVGSTLFVAHYNPRKKRARVADEYYSNLGGNLERFRAGDVHRLALEQPWDQHYIGPLVDRYHKRADKRIYWAIWSNSVGNGG